VLDEGKTEFVLNIFPSRKQILFTLRAGQNLISEHFGGVLTL
jgi:hypothetical protein